MNLFIILFMVSFVSSVTPCCCRKRPRIQPAPIQQPQPQPVDPFPTDPIRKIKHLRIKSVVD